MLCTFVHNSCARSCTTPRASSASPAQSLRPDFAALRAVPDRPRARLRSSSTTRAGAPLCRPCSKPRPSSPCRRFRRARACSPPPLVEPPALMLVDLDLPGISGIELIERVQERWPEVDIVAHAISETTTRCSRRSSPAPVDIAERRERERAGRTCPQCARRRRVDHAEDGAGDHFRAEACTGDRRSTYIVFSGKRDLGVCCGGQGYKDRRCAEFERAHGARARQKDLSKARRAQQT
jgi:hypothetical protein